MGRKKVAKRASSKRRAVNKRGPIRAEDDWAQRTVAEMSPEQVDYWLNRLGGATLMDARSPIERMVDEACGVDFPKSSSAPMKPRVSTRKRMRRP